MLKCVGVKIPEYYWHTVRFNKFLRVQRIIIRDIFCVFKQTHIGEGFTAQCTDVQRIIEIQHKMARGRQFLTWRPLKFYTDLCFICDRRKISVLMRDPFICNCENMFFTSLYFSLSVEPTPLENGDFSPVVRYIPCNITLIGFCFLWSIQEFFFSFQCPGLGSRKYRCWQIHVCC
jgi:hypothetical protein